MFVLNTIKLIAGVFSAFFKKINSDTFNLRLICVMKIENVKYIKSHELP